MTKNILKVASKGTPNIL